MSGRGQGIRVYGRTIGFPRRVADAPKRVRAGVLEALERRVFLSAGTAELGTVAAATSELSSVTVNAPRKCASENGPTARPFTLVRTGGDTSLPLRVGYVIGGKARNGLDYTLIKSWAQIGAGKTTVRVWVTPVDDAALEPVEAVTLTLMPRGTYLLGEQSQRTIRINDNDGPPPPVEPTDQRTQIQWNTVAASPIWRCEAQKGVVDGKLYIFGGFIDGMTGAVARSDVYDPATNQWTRLADLPTRLTHAATAVDGGKVYLAGGWVTWGVLGQQDYGTRDVWVYDVATNTYSKGPSLPEPRGAGAMVKLGRELHFLSGVDPTRTEHTDHWVLNLDNPAAGWVDSVPLPVGRNHPAAVVADGHIYFIGGQVTSDDLTGAQDEFYVWHPTWTAWKQLPDLPSPLSHVNEATLFHRGRILVFGGTTNGKQDLRTVSAYDPRTGQWTALTPLPAGRYTGLAMMVDDVIYYSTGGASTTYRGVFA